MQKVAFYSKWLDGSNGLVKDCPKNEMEQNETETLLLAMPSNSTAGLLARVVKSVVSFLQNLLFPQTHKEGVRRGQVSAFFQPAAAVVVGVDLLVGSNAEAQVPTYDVYGIDTIYWHVYVGGQWYETDTLVNNVYKPGGSIEGVASYRYAHPNYDCSPLSMHNLFTKESVKRTIWYSDGSYLNKENYREYCVQGKLRRDNWIRNVPLEDQDPAQYLSSKAMVVGTIEQALSSRVKRTKQHLTRLKITATHTSGVKNFTMTIKYRVEGSTEVTTVQTSVLLRAGGGKLMFMVVPGGGSWATIDSITFHENRPPDPPPAVVPVPVPVPSPRR